MVSFPNPVQFIAIIAIARVLRGQQVAFRIEGKVKTVSEPIRIQITLGDQTVFVILENDRFRFIEGDSKDGGCYWKLARVARNLAVPVLYFAVIRS